MAQSGIRERLDNLATEINHALDVVNQYSQQGDDGDDFDFSNASAVVPYVDAINKLQPDSKANKALHKRLQEIEGELQPLSNVTGLAGSGAGDEHRRFQRRINELLQQLSNEFKHKRERLEKFDEYLRHKAEAARQSENSWEDDLQGMEKKLQQQIDSDPNIQNLTVRVEQAQAAYNQAEQDLQDFESKIVQDFEQQVDERIEQVKKQISGRLGDKCKQQLQLAAQLLKDNAKPETEEEVKVRRQLIAIVSDENEEAFVNICSNSSDDAVLAALWQEFNRSEEGKKKQIAAEILQYLFNNDKKNLIPEETKRKIEDQNVQVDKLKLRHAVAAQEAINSWLDFDPEPGPGPSRPDSEILTIAHAQGITTNDATENERRGLDRKRLAADFALQEAKQRRREAVLQLRFESLDARIIRSIANIRQAGLSEILSPQVQELKKAQKHLSKGETPLSAAMQNKVEALLTKLTEDPKESVVSKYRSKRRSIDTRPFFNHASFPHRTRATIHRLEAHDPDTRRRKNYFKFTAPELNIGQARWGAGFGWGATLKGMWASWFVQRPAELFYQKLQEAAKESNVRVERKSDSAEQGSFFYALVRDNTKEWVGDTQEAQILERAAELTRKDPRSAIELEDFEDEDLKVLSELSDGDGIAPANRPKASAPAEVSPPIYDQLPDADREPLKHALTNGNPGEQVRHGFQAFNVRDVKAKQQDGRAVFRLGTNKTRYACAIQKDGDSQYIGVDQAKYYIESVDEQTGDITFRKEAREILGELVKSGQVSTVNGETLDAWEQQQGKSLANWRDLRSGSKHGQGESQHQQQQP